MITLLAKLRRHQIHRAHSHAERVQIRIERKITDELKNTVYAKDHGNVLAELPVVTYEDIFPYIERMLNGEKNILVHKKVCFFAKSSGTTNAKSKYIPTPKYFLKNNHYEAGKDMVAFYIASCGGSNLLMGKTLGISGSLSPSPGAPEILCGDVSALLTRELPWWVSHRKAIDLSVALLPNWEEKMQKIVENAKKYDVRAIAGTPTWVAIILEKIIEKEKVKNIEDVWPKLEVFFHGAVSFVPYKPLFENLSKKLKYLEVYNASEGYIAVQDNLEKTGELLLLINRDIFYEFLPIKHRAGEVQRILKLHEVKIGEEYALIISTTSGLYRYQIGDTIKFININPYRITITGRTKHFINAFGEEVIVENANKAIEQASLATLAIVSYFTAGPLYMKDGKAGAHEWYIEYGKEPDDQEKFNQTLDETLRKLNGDYDAKRTGDKVMTAPVVHVAPKGTFYAFMESKSKLGGQHKVPPLSNTREYLEEIKKATRINLSKK